MSYPQRTWIPWVKWLVLVSIFLLIVQIMSLFHSSNFRWLGIALMFVFLAKYRPVNQCFELQLNEHKVYLKLYLDIRWQIWVTYRYGNFIKNEKIGKFYGFPIWLHYPIILDGYEYKLLIYVKCNQQGFLVGNASQAYRFKICQNVMCF
jgi:hypothetical protein